MKVEKLVIVRGGGDLATGTIHRLHQAGFSVLVLETDKPTSIRRQVSFSEAVYDGTATVEGVTAKKIDSKEQVAEVLQEGYVAVLVDPEGSSIDYFKPFALVDAIIAKKNLGTTKQMAPFTIALGPGFEAGVDVDVVVETKRGHRLGRIIEEGCAIPNTGVPGDIAGFSVERVIHTPEAGVLHVKKTIGDAVALGEEIAVLETADGMLSIKATMPGFLRGMIRDGFQVHKHFKMADIDPRMGELENCFLISDKARCIAGSVLELVCKAYFAGEKS